MKNIYFRDGILIYYGNPAGYLSEGKVVLDSIFDKGEIIAYLSEKEKLAVEIRSGVYDRLSEVGGMEVTVQAAKGRRIRIYQLKQDSPLLMRFISLAEREKRDFEKPKKRSMRLFMRERWIPLVSKMSGRNLAEGCQGILKDMHYPYPM